MVGRLALMTGIVSLLLTSLVRGDDVGLIARPEVESVAGSPVETLPDEDQRRQNTAGIGVLILVGVAAIGLLLIAGVLIWGAKVRRMLRQPDAAATQQDGLWYLRNEMPAGTEPPTTTDSNPPLPNGDSFPTATDDTHS